MRVLLLCNIILPKVSSHINSKISCGGGWLSGVVDSIKNSEEIYVCSPIVNENKLIKGTVDNINYYCFPQRIIDPTKYNVEVEKYFEKIILEVNPDVIHVCGTEYPHTLAMINVCLKLNIIDKCIISIQGICSIIQQHYDGGIPKYILNRYTFRDLIKKDNIIDQKNKMRKRGTYEIEALKKVKGVIGRTSWDKAISSQINSSIKYYFCNESLRECFYNNTWSVDTCQRHSIFLSQASYPVKGAHYMLEALPIILKQFPSTHIYIAGNNIIKGDNIYQKLKISSYGKYLKRIIAKYKLENNVTFVGELSESEMCNRLLSSNVFVSCSTIENSPNSLGEAMILGVPCIASGVGGVMDMMTHKQEGYIYQVDAPYMLAAYIMKIFSDDTISNEFSKKARKRALDTHNKEKNKEALLKIYREIVGE